MVELMFAVVILGIGMLITSSMFPIAWFKAREVAEATVVPALADAAEANIRLVCPPQSKNLVADLPRATTSFFPGDWIPLAQPAPTGGGNRDHAFIYPDMRVHHLNAGNYLADTGEDFRNDAGTLIPIADDSWQLEDNLDVMLADRNPLLTGFTNGDPTLDVLAVPLSPHLRAHTRLSIPLDARPADTADTSVQSLWEERFELRRHCWSVFYRFNEMPGLEFGVESQADTEIPNARKFALAEQRLRKSRQLSMYYFTLKRPVNARYARQAGYDPDASSPAVVDLANPQARGPEFDVRLPVPWRFEAGLKTLPSASAAGVPSEIHVPANTLMATVLDDGYVLLDDRVGQVFRITDRRDGSVDGVASVIFTLDRDYTIVNGEYAPDYNRLEAGTRDAWEKESKWYDGQCDAEVSRVLADPASILPDDLPSRCQPVGSSSGSMTDQPIGEDEPARRTYWVFLPPVDRERGPNGIPLFNGSQPVVGVEVRQLTLAPPVARN
jgi:hypothetical protein